jgi:dienelactone hydrolase
MLSMIAALLVTASLWQAQTPPQPAHAAVIEQARAIVAALAAGEFSKVEAQYTAEVAAALPTGRLATLWAGLQQQAGTFKSCDTNARVTEIGDKRMVITPCQFGLAAIDLQFGFDSAGKIAGLSFRPGKPTPAASAPPPYATPAAYSETAMTIGSGEWTLPAILTMPNGKEPLPAVILVHGSGPQDRDETIGPNRPFRDLATGLASRGIAVLRYDKRSRVHGAKMAALKNLTVREETIEDALLAVAALSAEPRIDATRIFVLGHSLGGMLIPRIGSANPAIAGLIVLAGPARPLEDAIVAQARHLAMAADGVISADEQRGIDQTTALSNEIRALTAEDAKSGRMVAGAPAAYWLDLRGYDPPSAARQIKAPMLILQGERDFQVTMEEFAKWKAALGSRADVTFHSYPALNHLFIAGTGPSVLAEYERAGYVAEEVVRDMASWIMRPAR